MKFCAPNNFGYADCQYWSCLMANGNAGILSIYSIKLFVSMFKSHREVHDAFPKLNPILADHYSG